MRWAFALLGLGSMILLFGTYMLLEREPAAAPTPAETETDRAYEFNHADMITLTSPAFRDGEAIPSRYTCEGENIHPELRIAEVPEGTVSLVLVMEDPDIPESVKQNMGIEVFDHWVVFNMPAETTLIAERETPPGIEGMNSAGQGYTGPCPPDGEHRYIFTLYAADTVLQLNSAAGKAEVLEALQGHILERTTLTGVYEKSNQ